MIKQIAIIATLLTFSLLIVACGSASPANQEKSDLTSLNIYAPASESIDLAPVASYADESAAEEDNEESVSAENSTPASESESVTAVPQATTIVQANNNTSGSYPGDTTSRPLTAMGNPNAPVVIVEYSDYQCPFCRRHFQQTMPQLKEEFIDTGRVYYVFKDFPIAGLHPYAYRLHEAALCAADSGGEDAFWQSHDLFFAQAELFDQNSEAAMDEAILAQFAQLGLPVDEIEGCLVDGRFTTEVQDYINEGQSLGVRGTPSFFINGNPFIGAQPYETFQAAIIQLENGETIAQAAQQPQQPPQPAAAPTPAIIQSRTLTSMGNPDAPVTIVEYSDYQCPFCLRHFQETMPLLKENFIDTGRVYYVFKDFPIESLHPLAYRLHEAALCAADSGGQDTYWQSHDLFFNEAESFQVDTLPAMDAAILAAFDTAGLPDVQNCLANNEKAEIVQNGAIEGLQLGVTGTPAFFINGYPISGAQPYDLFEYAIGLAEEGKLAEAYQGNNANTQTQGAAPPAQPADVPLSDEPAKGSPDAPITIVEYSDYQCPFCLRHFQQTMPQLQQYIDAGQVRYVFKDFPIHSIHPQAQKAHETARCARELGGDDAYWTMHDLLFTNQDAWSTVSVPDHVAVLKELAAAAGLPQAEFDECLDSGRYYDAVNAELAEGTALGVRGTPAFFINGLPLMGAQPFSTFQQAIEQLLNAEE